MGSKGKKHSQPAASTDAPGKTLPQTNIKTKTKKAEQQDSDRYALAIAANGDGLWDWDLASKKVFFSPAWKAMLGFSSEEIADSPEEWLGRVHPDDIRGLEVAVDAHVRGESPRYVGECRLLHKDGTYRWMLIRGMAVRGPNGKIERVVGSQSDISHRKNMEERLQHDAMHDALTGLPNRALFVDRVQGCLARAQRRKNYLFAVLFLDLDRFKTINDGLGHAVGDKILIELSHLLQACIRPEDTVARIGGDEFTILLDGIEDLNAATRVANRVLNALQVPFPVAGQDVFTTCSIGIAISQTGYERPDQIIRDADTAMYRAKTSGKARHQVFDTSMHERAVKLLQLETDLRHAIDREEFVVYYQAIRSLEHGNTIGFEALVRWIHPERGIVYPADFIAVAEETGLIVQLGWWVLYEACRQTRIWQSESGSGVPLAISVNISCTQFAQPDLVHNIIGILRQTGLEPSSLKLEITESAVMSNPEAASETLLQLRALGIKVCIDDFGTGYSSLSYLMRFPIDTLKIDRSFISGMGAGINNTAIVQTIINLAHNLGMDVVAEGVETAEQLEQLRTLNCEHAQGYYFARPAASVDAIAQARP